MKYLYKKRHYYISLFTIFMLLIQVFSPFLEIIVFAEGDNGLSITQSVDKTVVAPGDIVTVTLRYSSGSSVASFQDVQLSYTIPKGFIYKDYQRSSHVKGVPIHKDGTITFDLADEGSTGNILSAGKSGDVKVIFQAPNPSVYPNDTNIGLKAGKIEGKVVSNSEIATASSNTLNLTMKLGPSWIVTKNVVVGNEEKHSTSGNPIPITISKNPDQKSIDVNYRISLKNGNIDLKDVKLKDTLPDNATYVSHTPNNSNVTFSKDSSGKNLTWALKDVPAGKTTSIDVKIRYAIFRKSGDQGVKKGDLRTNTISVTGFPIIMNQGSGEKEKHSEEITFKEASDSVTITFQESTAVWKVETTGPKEIIITKDLRKKEVDGEYNLILTGGDIPLKDVVLTYTLGNDEAYTILSPDVSGITKEGNKLIWRISEVDANVTLSKTIRLTYPIAARNNGIGVAHNDTRIHHITGTGKSKYDNSSVTFNPATDEVTTKFIDSDEEWYLEKTAPSAVVIPDETDPNNNTLAVEYTIKLKSTGHYDSTGNYNVDLKTVNVKDVLPDNATYKTSTITPSDYGGKVNITEGDHWVNWQFTDVDTKNPPAIKVTLEYPIAKNLLGASISNTVTATGYPIINGSGGIGSLLTFRTGTISVENTNKATTKFISQSPPSPKVELTIDDYNEDTNNSLYKHFDHGYDVVYNLDFDNLEDHGHDLYDASLVQELSSDIDYTSISLGKSSSAVSFQFWYKTDGDWMKYDGSFNTSTESTLTVKDFTKDKQLTGVKLKFNDKLPKDFQLSKKIRLIGKIKDSAIDRSTIQSNGYLDYQYIKRFDSEKASGKAQDTISFLVYLKTAWISNLEKKDLTQSARGYDPGDEILFELSATNHSRLATDLFKNPIFIDILPKGFELVENSEEVVGGTASKPDLTKDSIGDRTLLIWRWSSDDLLKGETLKLQYKVKIKDYTKPTADDTKYANEFYVSSNGKFLAEASLIKIDGDDLDKDSSTEDTILVAEPVSIKVNRMPGLSTSKWVRGHLDPVDGYTNSPNASDAARTTPGGAADYKLIVQNTGNIKMTEIEIVDILSHIGDSEVLRPNVKRGSTWRPYLLEQITKGNFTYDNGSSINATTNVFYSKLSNPKRKGPYGEDIASSNDDWSETPPKDITKVQSLKFNITNINGGTGLEPGKKLVVKWKMRTPVDSNPTSMNGGIAWNSISTSGIGETDEDVFLPAEPFKVGIKVDHHVNGEIGNFVWFDKDKNGRQDDGYDGQAAGINGIKVKLFKKEGVSWIEKDETLTGPRHSQNAPGIGSPGYYLFPKLEAGTYYVEFYLPKDYYKETPIKDPDDGLNSDGESSKEEGDYRVVKSKEVTITGTEKNHHIDLGLVAATDDGEGLKLEKQAYKFKYKSSNTEVNFDNPTAPLKPVNIGETITYRFVLQNTGTVPLHNIKLKDILSDFRFTNIVNSDDTTKPITEDARITKSSDTELTLDKLELNEEYVFEGTYTVKETDLPGPLQNTVQVWANELNDGGSTGDTAAKQSTVEVDIADYSLEKVVSKIEKVDSPGTYITPPDGKLAEVEVGDKVTYKMTVTNNGSIALKDITVKDPRINMTETITEIPVGGSKFVTKEYTIKVEDLSSKSITNTATVEDPDKDQLRFTKTDQCNVKIKHFTITKIADRSTANIGDTIRYTINLTNDGGTDLKNIQITDKLTTGKNTEKTLDIFTDSACTNKLSNPIPTLVKGQTKTFYAKYEVKEVDDISDASTQKISNTVNATRDGYGDNADTQDTADVDIAHIDLDKTVIENAGSKAPYAIREVIHYKVTVKNKGSKNLTGITVTDSIKGINIFTEAINLNAGDTWSKDYTYTVKESDISTTKLKNTANATHTDIKTTQAKEKAKDSKEVDTMGITLEKTGEKVDKTNPLKEGSQIKYTFKVKNIGSADLSNVVINDDKLTGDINVGDLSSGETKTISDQLYTVKDTDLPGAIKNTATVTGKDSSKTKTVPATDHAYVANSAIELKKYVHHGTYDQTKADNAIKNDVNSVQGLKDDVVTYIFVVKNISDAHLNNIQIKDDYLGITRATPSDSNKVKYIAALSSNTHPTFDAMTKLATSEELVFYYETTLTKDLSPTTSDAYAYGNPVSKDVDGTESLGSTVHSKDPAGVDLVNPQITLKKTAYIGAYKENEEGHALATGLKDDLVTYVFTITNTGDTYLNDIMFKDEFLSIVEANIKTISGLNLISSKSNDPNKPLAPGQKLAYYYHDPSFKLSKDIVNTANVLATPTDTTGKVIETIDTANYPKSESSATVDKIIPVITLKKEILTSDGMPADKVYRQDGKPITYQFTITNTAEEDITLTNFIVTDDQLSMTKNFPDLTLTKGQSKVLTKATTVREALETNTGVVHANPLDSNGKIVSSIDVTASDTANIKIIKPSVKIEKTVALGNITDPSKAKELVEDYHGKPITYFFKISNTGDTYLSNKEINKIRITDTSIKSDGSPLEITPLEEYKDTKSLKPHDGINPDDFIIYYYQTTVNGNIDKENAKVIATPSDENGDKLVGILEDVTDENDASVQALSKIGDYVWLETKLNDTDVPTKEGIKGVTLYLKDKDGNPVKDTSGSDITATTDDDGYYWFEKVKSGEYIIEVDTNTLNIYSDENNPDGLEVYENSYASDHKLDHQTKLIVPSTGTTDGITGTGPKPIDTVDFGYKHTGKITGTVWIDGDKDGNIDSAEEKLSNITITLKNVDTSKYTIERTTTTNSNGTYTFEDLPLEKYEITVTESSDIELELVSDPDRKNPLSNSFITEKLSGTKKTISDIDFGYIYAGSIGDLVWYDLDEDGVKDADEEGIPAISVTLKNNGTGKSITTVTKDGTAGTTKGMYLFENLPKGNYTVTVTMPADKKLKQVSDLVNNKASDSSYEPKNTYICDLDKGEKNLKIDFGYNHTGSISGHVLLDSNSNGKKDTDENIFVIGSKVKLIDPLNKITRDPITIDDTGKYSFEKLPAGDYRVEVEAASHLAPSYNINKNHLDLKLDSDTSVNLMIGEKEVDIDFGYKGTGVIEGVIWQDEENYKVIDTDENLIKGIKVKLMYFDENGKLQVKTTTTKDGGKYAFNELLPREYTVEVDKNDPKLKELLSTYIFKMDLSIIVDKPDITSTVVTLTKEVTSQKEVNFGYRSKIPNLKIKKTANKSEVTIGDSIKYAFTITNTGETVLTNVYLKDELLDLNTNLGDLTVGEAVYVNEEKYPALKEKLEYKTSQKDVKNPIAGKKNAYKIINKATANSDQTNEVSATYEVTLNTNPALELKKTGPQGTVRIGQEVSYTLLLTNEGDTVLHDVYLEDELLNYSEYIGDLSVGESVYSTPKEIKYTVKQKDAPKLVNIATAKSKETGVVKSNEWRVDVQINPNIKFIKTGPKGAVKVGDEIDYILTVINTGDTVLQSVYVEDAMLDFDEFFVYDEFNPDHLEKFYPTKYKKYKVTEEDYWRGFITNTAYASFTVSESVYGSVYKSERVPSTWNIGTITANQNFEIEKTVKNVNGVNGNIARVGDTLEYTIKVTNTGDVRLDDIHVVDPLINLDEKVSIERGTSKTFTETYVITKADETAKKVINTATASHDKVGTKSDSVETTIKSNDSGSGGSGGGDGGSTPDPGEDDDKTPDQGGDDDKTPDEGEDDDKTPDSGGGGGGSVPKQPDEPKQPEEEQPNEVDESEEQEEPKPQEFQEQLEEPQQPDQVKTTQQNIPIGGKIEVSEDSSIKIEKEPEHGQVIIHENGEWEYKPNPDFVGKDTFTITITDENGNEEEIIIEIDVDEIPLGKPDFPKNTKTLPKTGEVGNGVFYLVGMLFVFIGIMLKRKKA
ncbi:MAG: Ig-like domain-containing protein [Marinisporobacter sp.]|nr:Ig-like domain-containing protein [Marinisporobacter sp.]